MTTDHKANMTFEAQVRQTAEAVWNMEPGSCQPMHYPNDPVVREIDGIARLRDVTHLLMVTTSTRLDKVRDDTRKLQSAETIERNNNAPAISKWLITLKQLDAEHIEYARKQNVKVLTLAQFQRRFFDAAKYLAMRARSAFGSARNPLNESITIPDGAYVNLPMRVAADSNRSKSSISGKAITLPQICSRILAGEMIILRAPFGAGKSLTTRELFKLLVAAQSTDAAKPIPLALNLREHWGENHFDEILDRHARGVGYTPREDLVLAWRAGMCCLLLDGYDEVAAQTLVRTADKNFMREARRHALSGVRDFTQKMPATVGVFICGRDQYFDSEVELASSLGIGQRRCLIIDLGEFDEASANDFLARNGVTKPLPDWLPRKPLLLSYLLRESLMEEILSIDGSKGFAHAWDSFLTAICAREAALDRSVMELETVRSVLERLAFSVRGKANGTGPISGVDLAEAYTAETSQSAGEGVLAQLQRLPGLAQRDAESGTRSFVDADMLSALQGGAFARQALRSFRDVAVSPLAPLSARAQEMAAYKLGKENADANTLIGIASELARSGGAAATATMQHAADCLGVAMHLAIAQEVATLNLRDIVIDGAYLDSIALDEISLRNASFRNCIVNELRLAEATEHDQISFSGCIIGRIVGASSRGGVPTWLVSQDCEVDQLDDVSTNNAVLKLDISPQLKALLTILRKLYRQAGSGRKLAAFSRGITRPDVLAYVDPVLAILQRHQFISVFNSVVHPVRRQSGRVSAILSSPTLADDPVVVETRNLQ